MRSLVLPIFLVAAALDSVHAAETPMPVPGDCAMFREGGAGYILTAPTYYVRGTITEVYTRRHPMALCPNLGKPAMRYTRADWKRMADAYPCVTDPAQVKDVDAIRIRMRADQWETPWTLSHGQNGWLFHGHYLDVELKEGAVLDIDGTLLERCEKAD